MPEEKELGDFFHPGYETQSKPRSPVLKWNLPFGSGKAAMQ